MSNLRSSKSLAERIDINYWTHPHPLRRWKRWLAVLAGVAAIAWLVLATVLGDQRIYMAGPLSTAHTLFENDCARCHTESWQPAARLLTGDAKRRSVPDRSCLPCHDGPPHNDQQVSVEVPNCVICHREHRGELELSRVADVRCVACHADLHTVSGTSSVDPHVERFVSRDNLAAGHPEFVLLRRGETDRAAIKLNHAVHLKPEGIVSAGDQREVLECSSCHLPDSERRGMQPIRYQEHCSRCHFNALSFDAERFADNPAPHRDVETVTAVVRHRYVELVRQQPEVLGQAGTPAAAGRRVPGRFARVPLNQPEWEWVEHETEKAVGVLLESAGGCRFCHVVEQSGSAWSVVAPAIPNRWLSHAQFSHDPHRMPGCTRCHPAATSTDTSDVLLPSIQVCYECHSPERGARTDCVECHRYHERRE